MSRSIRGEKPPGTDWWKRRPNSGMSANTSNLSWWKRNTNKRERMAARMKRARAAVVNDCCCPDIYLCGDEIECPRHGGFDVCCGHPELHVPARVDDGQMVTIWIIRVVCLIWIVFLAVFFMVKRFHHPDWTETRLLLNNIWLCGSAVVAVVAWAVCERVEGRTSR